MSLNSIQSRISSVQGEIERLNRRLSEKGRDEASKSSRIAQINRSINQNTSPSMLQSKLREIDRHQNDIARIQKEKADLTKQIADKTEKLHRHQREFYKEQEREQNKMMRSLEQKQHEEQRQQHALLESLRVTALESRETVAIVSTGEAAAAAMYDAFISHANEDKDDLVRPLADRLLTHGISLWYDEFQLKVGDSLRRSIDAGLVKSRFGIVVLSPSFFAKNWPQYELDGLVQREMAGGKVILPLWHKVSKDEVLKYSPPLADKVALNTAMHTIDELAKELASVLKNV